MADTAELQPCGTWAAAQRHRKRGQPLCDPCAEAARAYRKQWRASNLAGKERERQANLARTRAVQRLVNLHRAEFTQLEAAERRKVGF